MCSREIFKIYIFRNQFSNHNDWWFVNLLEILIIILELNKTLKMP